MPMHADDKCCWYSLRSQEHCLTGSLNAPTAIRAAICGLFAGVLSTAALADARQLSLMPDPRGEFIRLCAPFMVKRYSRPEAVCDCLHHAMFERIDDQEVLDAVLYGVTERGVPTLNRSWLQPEKWPLIDPALSAIAEPTMQCMFGSTTAARIRDGVSGDSATQLPAVQDLTP